MYVISESFCIF